MLDLLENRFNWASFRLTMGHVKFLINNFLPEMSIHSRQQDETQVREHYDRGNDFYAAFLGPRMIYTSGIITKPDERETLEELQDNKMRLVCEKMQLKKGEKHLDIGCGWGTLLAYAAKEYGVESTGVTLAREQTEFGLQRAKEWGVEKNVNILCHDYRDIPRSDAPGGIKYNKITCLEMAEHVGVFNFNKFLLQVSELLEVHFHSSFLFYLFRMMVCFTCRLLVCVDLGSTKI
jgi:cyclopropane fatty-acyl-phospholipid synthase-like methyltransferase